MKKYIKEIGKYIAIYIFLIIVFIALLIITSLIPEKMIKNNVEKSAKQLKDKELAEDYGIFKEMVLDNFTDALMINTAYSIDTKDVLMSIVTCKNSYLKNRKIDEGPIKNLNDIINAPKEDIQYNTYGRYWHGYLIYLRPLLTIFSYKAIRIMFTIILDILAVILVIILAKKTNKIIATLFAIALVCVSYQYAGMSITYFPVLLISILTSLYIAVKEKINYKAMFIIGGLTSFFDLLTTPLLTLGIPLLIYLVIKPNELSLKKIILIMLNWIIGYTIIWTSKWIISDMVFKTNIIQEALENIASRGGAYVGGEKMRLIDALLCLIYYVRYVIIFLIFLTAMTVILKTTERIEVPKREILKYIIIGSLPIIWCEFTKNHTCLHPKFVYRNLMITIFSVLMINYKILKEAINKKEGK